MRYCRNCGKMLDDSETVCPICGTPVSVKNIRNASQHIPEQTDDPYKKQKRQEFRRSMNWCGLIGFILSLLSTVLNLAFCIPSIISWILCAIGERQRNKYPTCSNLAIIGKFYSIIIFVFWLIIFVFGSIFIFACS